MKRTPTCRWMAADELQYELLASARRRYHIERVKLEIQHRLDPIRFAIARLVNGRVPALNAWASTVIDEHNDDAFVKGFLSERRSKV